MVYPTKEDKINYIQRYKNRGNNEKFISLMESNFDKFIDSMEKRSNTGKISISKGKYLSDVLK